MDASFPSRKPIRLKHFNYGSCGAYFITVCTKNKADLFWNTTEYNTTPAEIPLSSIGKTVERAIMEIPKYYPNIKVDHFAIMPNHIHLLLFILCEENEKGQDSPTIPVLVQQLKGKVTKTVGKPIWQKSFYDHVIRNRTDYEEHVTYIQNNPLRYLLRKKE